MVVLHCDNNEAYFGKGTKLTVLETGREIEKPKVEILYSSKSEPAKTQREGKKKTLVCVASEFYPDHVSISWECSRGSCNDVATDNMAKRVDKYYRITSRLRISTEFWENPENTFTCNVTFFDGKNDEPVFKTIPGVKGKPKGLTREKYLSVTQEAKLSYCVFIAKGFAYAAFVGFVMWKLQGKQRKR
ncbi:unnamed protein product [Ophioblennius macclurei]